LHSKQTREILDGVKALQLTMLDGNLEMLTIKYEETVEWENINEFIGRLVEVIKTPGVRYWQLSGYDQASIVCQNISIKVRFIDNERK
jgi:hypothetical protein